MSISAMKQALEAIKETDQRITPGGLNSDTRTKLQEAITALRQAIAEAEKREWVELTDEEIMEVVDQITTYRGEYMVCVGNAIEAKLKEKNT
jgi:uncharacterized membrane protein YcgQ (UPF0703/DUF1980 family)